MHHKTIIQHQRPKSTTNWRSYIKNIWNQKKHNYAITNHQGLRPRRIEVGWMDYHQWNEETRNIKKSYYMVSSHVTPLIANLDNKDFEKNYYGKTPRGYI